MKRIAIIHTVASVFSSFPGQLRQILGEDVLIHNILDDFLATDPIEKGSFTEINELRLKHDMENAALTGCDLIVTSCSTLSPSVERLRGSFSTPIITIDEAMMRRAMKYGAKIAVLATAQSTVVPTVTKLQQTATALGKTITVETFVCTEAMDALRKGNIQEHDRLVLALSKHAMHSDVCVLAQASMAHLQASIEEMRGIVVLSSPPLCIQQIATFLAKVSE